MRTRHRRTLTLAALLVLAGGPLAACAGDPAPEPPSTPDAVEVEPQEDAGTTPTAEPDDGSGATGAPTERGEVDLVSVVQAAGDAERGTVVAVEWDEGPPAGWDVVLNQSGRGVELLLDAGDLGVVERGRTSLDADERDLPDVPVLDALQRAGAAVPGIVEGFSTGREDGVQVFEMRVRGEGDVVWEVLVSTRDGSVLRKEREG